MRKKWKRAISTKSKLFKEQLAFAKGWTKHSPMRSEAMEVEDADVWGITQGNTGIIYEVYFDIVLSKYVMKTTPGYWYELPEGELEKQNKERGK